MWSPLLGSSWSSGENSGQLVNSTGYRVPGKPWKTGIKAVSSAQLEVGEASQRSRWGGGVWKDIGINLMV